jgi:hypothetical protein
MKIALEKQAAYGQSGQPKLSRKADGCWVSGITVIYYLI